MLDHLHRAVGVRIVFDEAADEADDHGSRRCMILNGSDGSRRSRFSKRHANVSERQEEEDKPDEGTRTAHDRN